MRQKPAKQSKSRAIKKQSHFHNCLKFNYLTCDPVGIKPLRGFFPALAPRAILHEHRRMCQAAPALFMPCLPVPEQAPVLSVTVRKTPDQSQAHSAFLCDPVGIRTQDPQLRRLLLYPAELPDRPLKVPAKI